MTESLSENVLRNAKAARDALDPTSWLGFSKLCQLQRYELNEVLDGRRQINPISFMRIAFALETVGVKTHLSELDADTRRIVMALGSFEKGEIKDFFEKEWHRVPFTKYVCEGHEYTADMRQRVHTLSERIHKGAKISKKSKLDLGEVVHIKHALKKTPASSLASAPAPASPPPTESADTKRVQRTVDSIYSSVNSLSNIAGANLHADEVSEASKINIAEACAKLLHNVGVTGATLEKFQSRRMEVAADSGTLSSIMGLFPKTK